MHIAEGVLSPPVLAAGGVLALGACAWGLRRLDEERLMPAALVSAAFFTASLIHVPIGPAVNAHLLLNGLAGVFLGWAAFPALAVALLLQALLFQFGGLTSLGVNVVNMAAPAVAAGLLARPWLARPDVSSRTRLAAAGICGGLAVLGSAVLTACSLAASGEALLLSAKALLWAHLPIAVVEGLVTASVVAFLAKVRPEMLTNPERAHAPHHKSAAQPHPEKRLEDE